MKLVNRNYFGVVLIAFVVNSTAFAQWLTTGTNTYNNPLTNFVGIGTSTPNDKLEVNGNIRLGWNVGSTIGWIYTPSPNYAAGLKFLSSGRGLDIFSNMNDGAGYISFTTVSTYGGSPTERIRIISNGNVGIGTTTPGFPLNFASIVGDKISLYGSVGAHYGFGVKSGLLQIHTDGSASDIVFGYGSSTSFTEGMRIKGNGNVGIGTALTNNPNNYKLAVNGTIGAKGVNIEITSTTWADYVFEKKYKMMSLEEVEQFIFKNKHLPNIPSACDVEKQGIDVGLIEAKLLEKIEELTLYIIGQEKRIKELEAKSK